jgi:hypothetical protein
MHTKKKSWKFGSSMGNDLEYSGAIAIISLLTVFTAFSL